MTHEHLHGAVRQSTFLDAGMSRATLQRRIKRGDLRRMARQVVALPGAPDGMMLDLAGGVLALGQAVVTGETAAWLRAYITRRPAVGHLAVPATRGGMAIEGIDIRRESHYRSMAISIIDGLPVSGAAWTLMDAARDLPDRAFVAAVASALSRRDVTIDTLKAAAAERGRWHGSARFRRLVGQMGRAHTHSAEEAYARRLLGNAGLRPHPMPLKLIVGDRVIAEADIPFVAERVDIEVDGPHHLLIDQLTKDRVRDRRVAEIDWLSSRFPSVEIRHDPGGFVREVQSILASRRRQLRARVA